MIRFISTLGAVVLASSATAGQPQAPAAPEQQLAQVRALADSVVTVEYTLKYDKGEPPRLGLGRPEGGEFYGEAGEFLVKQERPVEVFSYLLGDDLVISEEVPVHERFIDRIEVRFRDQVVPAAPVAWATRRHGTFLKLLKPLAGARPLTFHADLPGPYTGLVAAADHGVPCVMVTPFAPTAVISAELGDYFTMPSEAIAVDKSGRAVGMSMSQYLPAGETWKGDPRKWEKITVDERQAMIEKVSAAADRGVVRVTLNFRSPRSQPNPFMARMRLGGGGEEEAATEQHLVGIVLEDGRVIVPAMLKSDVTARLERIRIHTTDGEARTATFIASLRDYGALIARLDPPAGGLRLAAGPITRYFSRLLPHAHIEVRGEERLVDLGHRRIVSFNRGWRNNIYPVVADDRGDTYLFDEDGALVAFPIARRPRFADEGDGWRQDAPQLTAAGELAGVLADLESNIDPSNIPLSESEESRIAWLGIVVQRLDRELARANRVAELTRDGQTGVLVNFVYEGSPAAGAGVEPGWILLRLHVPGYPQPVPVTVDEGSAGYPLPWDRLDEIPEEFFDRLPPPWPSASNALTQTLTEVGFGAQVEAEFFFDGARIVKPFTIEQSPPHYDSAARHRSDTLGVTVRDLTYEVRQYFQFEADDPGVIISRVEPGSRVSVAGIKPYEMVTHINGQPVHNVQEFAELTGPGGELRLTVRRMTRTRQVPVRVPAGPVEPEPASVERQNP